ncbi:hypothetical protein AAHB33_15590 [Paenarthrobacter sp. S56]|uniref:hypothetical protein n=1 Tax=Paenarthrobacter sp. S56 TaxID=3138179 RepID=UPI00321B9049
MLLGVLVATGNGTPTAQLAGDLAILAAVLTALTTHTRAALKRQDNVAGRWFVAAGLAVWSAGQAIWTINGIALDHDYPFPSIADIGFVWYALPAAIGLMLLLRGQGRQLSLRRTILDAGVVASSTFFIAWSSLLGPLAAETDQDPLAHATQMAYPIADVFMVSVVIVLTMRAARGRRMPWLCLGIGFWILALTDLAYMRLTLEEIGGVTGSPLGLWMGPGIPAGRPQPPWCPNRTARARMAGPMRRCWNSSPTCRFSARCSSRAAGRSGRIRYSWSRAW